MIKQIKTIVPGPSIEKTVWQCQKCYRTLASEELANEHVKEHLAIKEYCGCLYLTEQNVSKEKYSRRVYIRGSRDLVLFEVPGWYALSEIEDRDGEKDSCYRLLSKVLDDKLDQFRQCVSDIREWREILQKDPETL